MWVGVQPTSFKLHARLWNFSLGVLRNALKWTEGMCVVRRHVHGIVYLIWRLVTLGTFFATSPADQLSMFWAMRGRRRFVEAVTHVGGLVNGRRRVGGNWRCWRDLDRCWVWNARGTKDIVRSILSVNMCRVVHYATVGCGKIFWTMNACSTSTHCICVQATMRKEGWFCWHPPRRWGSFRDLHQRDVCWTQSFLWFRYP